MSEERATKIASYLLKINAVKLSPQAPFTWASGMRSPIYCDNRMTLSYPEVRTYLKKSFAAAIRENFPDVQGVAGVATAGIPHGALVAEELGLPFCYIRSKAKAHGLNNMIEGKVEPDHKYVVIEDLVSTGGSSLKAIEALRSAGGEVQGLVSIFTYGFEKAVNAFANANVPFVSLTNLNHLLRKAVEIKYIRSQDLSSIQQWQENPSKWSDLQTV